jgi:outer membrane protein
VSERDNFEEKIKILTQFLISMRSIKVSFLVLGLLFYSLAEGKEGPGDSSVVFNLEQCIDYALNNNESIKNAVLETTSSRYRVKETFGLGLPQVDGELGYSNDFAIRTIFLPAEFFAEDPASVPDNAAPVPVRFGIPHTASAGIQIRQLIFDGSYLVGLQAANVYQELSHQEVVRSRINTVEAVTKAFYTVLINRERMGLISQNYLQLDTLLRETSMMYQNGFAEKIDVDRIRVRFNNLRTEQRNMNRTLALSYQILKFQMGMPLDHELRIEGSLSNLNLDGLDLDQEINRFKYDQRIEFAMMNTQRELAMLNHKNRKVANYPNLYGFVGAGFNSGTNTFSELSDFSANWFGYGNVGVSLSIPIFSGLQRSYRIQQAKIEVLQRENDLQSTRRIIAFELEQARTLLRSSLESLESQRENMELASGIYNVTKIKYQAGVGSNLEVVEAETTYKESETNYYLALFDALIAKIELEKALGILIK